MTRVKAKTKAAGGRPAAGTLRRGGFALPLRVIISQIGEDCKT